MSETTENTDLTENTETVTTQKASRTASTFPKKVARYAAVFVNSISMFLAFLAGRDLKIMSSMPSGEITKSAVLGSAMVVIACLAGYAGGLAAEKYFDAPFLMGAIMWALFIVFAVDRPILTAMMEMEAKALMNGGKVPMAKKVFTNVLRILIVMVTGYLVAAVLQIKIFDTEVNNQLAQNAQEKKEALIVQKESEINSVHDELINLSSITAGAQTDHQQLLAGLESKVAAARADVKNLEQELIDEVQGEVGSGKRGDGPAAKAIRVQIESAKERLAKIEAELAEAKTSSVTAIALNDAVATREAKKAALEADIKRIEGELERGLEMIEEQATNGFLDEYRALQQLWGEAFLQMLAVLLTIMLVELLVIILKQFLGPGPYERALARQYQQADAESQARLEEKLRDHQQLFEQAEIARREAEKTHTANLLVEMQLITKNRLAIHKAENSLEAGIAKSDTELIVKKSTQARSMMEKISEVLATLRPGSKDLREAQARVVAKLIAKLDKLKV